MASDIYQLFIRETGVFCCLVSEKSPAKLRFLYESAPLAFLVEVVLWINLFFFQKYILRKLVVCQQMEINLFWIQL